MFPRIKFTLNMETNFTKILRKIKNENNGNPTNLKISDMIQAEIFVHTYDEVISVYKRLMNSQELNLVKIKNEISLPLKRISLFVIFNSGILCEIKLKFG